MANRHQAASGGGGGVQLGLIITPMLDMSFQILAFFIMTYHPSALEGHIPGSLAPPDNPATKSKDNTNPVPMAEPPFSVPEEDLIPGLQEAIQIRIKANLPGPPNCPDAQERPGRAAPARAQQRETRSSPPPSRRSPSAIPAVAPRSAPTSSDRRDLCRTERPRLDSHVVYEPVEVATAGARRLCPDRDRNRRI